MQDISVVFLATLPAAKATGNMTLRPFSVVHSLIYDEQKKEQQGYGSLMRTRKK